jgi:Tfp pilus assembly PilM family ATPase
MENYPDAAAGALLLCGGGARLAGLPETLTRDLGIPVTRLEPCAALAANRGPAGADPPPQSGLATCIGLALGDLR